MKYTTDTVFSGGKRTWNKINIFGLDSYQLRFMKVLNFCLFPKTRHFFGLDTNINTILVIINKLHKCLIYFSI